MDALDVSYGFIKSMCKEHTLMEKSLNQLGKSKFAWSAQFLNKGNFVPLVYLENAKNSMDPDGPYYYKKNWECGLEFSWYVMFHIAG